MVKKNDVALSEALGHEVTDKRIDILRRIGHAGSISEAAREAGVSYKAAWQAIDTLSNLAGAVLVERAVGGSGGGGAVLTKAGEQLLHASDTLNAARREALQKLDQEHGEDAVMPGLSALGLRTSMRNQFACLVKKLKKSGPSIRAELVLANNAHIYSRITRESAELLGLHPGQSVLALCKATAVSVAASIAPLEGFNVLQGEVSRITRYGSGVEISMELMPGLHVVGFAETTNGLKLHTMAMASLDESSVVIAISG